MLPYQPLSMAFLTATAPFWEEDGLAPGMWTNGLAGNVMPQRFGATPEEVTGFIVQARGGLAQLLGPAGPRGGAGHDRRRRSRRCALPPRASCAARPISAGRASASTPATGPISAPATSPASSMTWRSRRAACTSAANIPPPARAGLKARWNPPNALPSKSRRRLTALNAQVIHGIRLHPPAPAPAAALAERRARRADPDVQSGNLGSHQGHRQALLCGRPGDPARCAARQHPRFPQFHLARIWPAGRHLAAVRAVRQAGRQGQLHHQRRHFRAARAR